MSREGEPIRDVVVVGDGIVAWSAAAAIRGRLPHTQVTLVTVPVPPDALADRIGATLPSVGSFHRSIGLDEADLVARTASGFRLGTRFEGWVEDRESYFHGYGEHGSTIGPGAFHHHWIAAARRGRGAEFSSHSPAAGIAQAGRFIPPADDPRSPLSTFTYGLQINPAAYRNYMRAFAQHLGVKEQAGPVEAVRLSADSGFIEALVVADGREIGGHLFIDCTGPAASVRAQLGDDFQPWDHWLLCDSLLAAETPAQPDPPAFDQAIAFAAGWRWKSPAPVRTSQGIVYASAFLSDGKAERTLRTAGAATSKAPIGLRQGRLAEPWTRNCVAIGDAAVTVEPLEWTNLYLAHQAISRHVAM